MPLNYVFYFFDMICDLKLIRLGNDCVSAVVKRYLGSSVITILGQCYPLWHNSKLQRLQSTLENANDFMRVDLNMLVTCP